MKFSFHGTITVECGIVLTCHCSVENSKIKKIKIKIQKVALWKMPYTRIKIINIPAASLPRKRKNVQVCQSQSVGHVIHSLPAGTETLSWLIFQHLQKQEQQMKD